MEKQADLFCIVFYFCCIFQECKYTDQQIDYFFSELFREGDNIKRTLLKYTEEQLQEKEDYEETPEELERSWQQLVTRLKRDGMWKEDQNKKKLPGVPQRDYEEKSVNKIFYDKNG